MKNILLILVLVLSSISLNAQSHLFVKAGIAYSDIFISNVPNKQASFRFGPEAGLLYLYQLPNTWNLRAELLYSVKGFNATNDQGYKSIRGFGYLNLPLLAGYKVGKFNIELGPELGYVLRETLRSDDPFVSGNAFVEDRFEVGAVVGLSYELTHQFLINLRYSRGLTSVFKVFYSDTGLTISEENVYNHSFQLSASWRLF